MFTIAYDYWNDFVAKIIILIITFTTIVIASLYSFFFAFIIVGSYISGCVSCWLIILYKNVIFKYIPQYSLMVGYTDFQEPMTVTDTGKIIKCDLCNKGKCLRHKARSVKDPWNNLFIHKDLDYSVKKLYEKIYENFVTKWYQDICNDQRFEYAIKKSFKFATSILLQRVKEVDFPILLMDKLLPVALSHVHGVSKSIQSHKTAQTKSNEADIHIANFAICAKPYIQHCALKDRSTEIEYMRLITAKLIPLLIDKEDHECRNFISLIREILACWVLLPLTDCLADPATINNLIVSLFSNTRDYDESNKSRKVLLLEDFCKSPKLSKFYQEKATLDLLLKNHNKLYSFMQYLKRTDRINLLQFCLHIDEMNDLLMTSAVGSRVDDTQKHLTNLHKSLQTILNVYLRSNSSDHLMEFVTLKQLQDIEAITKSDPQKVGLANVTPIYELYDKVFSYLNGLLYDYYTSPEFLEFSYGPKYSIEMSKTSFNSPLRSRQHHNQINQSLLQQTQSQSRLSNISTKIKDALRGGLIDGQILSEDLSYSMEHADSQSANYFARLQDYIVKVLSIEVNSEAQTSEGLFRVFCECPTYAMHCSQNDMLSKFSQNHFIRPYKVINTVKEGAFHMLRSEVGCTGEWDVLPDFRTHSLEERRLSYELFLQSLVANRFLSRKQQQCIAAFLISPKCSKLSLNVDVSSEENFMSASGMATDCNIGANFYQSVAHKLRKERGQHLQCFTSSLFKNVQESTTNSSHPASIAENTEKIYVSHSTAYSKENLNSYRMLTNRFSFIFNDHFRDSRRFIENECFYSAMPSVMRGPSQCFLFLLVRLLSAPKILIRIILALSNFFGTFLDKIINLIVKKQFVKSIEIYEIGLATIVNKLTETLFPIIKSEKSKKLILKSNNVLLYDISKQKLCKFLETKKLCKYWPELSRRLCEIHQAVQHPTLNKQLIYNLFDIALVEVFPELNNTNN